MNKPLSFVLLHSFLLKLSLNNVEVIIAIMYYGNILQELFALRNKDKKSNKRIQSMLKRTKSANKSVIEDAVDNVNTAITAAGTCGLSSY